MVLLLNWRVDALAWAMFMLLWVWNYLFGSIMLAWLPSAFGWNAVLVKFLTMACQFAWGYPLCKEVIFR